jgi:hypothetical protein
VPPEKIKGDGSNGISTEESDTFQPGTYPGTPDQAYADCLAVNVTDLSKQGYSNVGAPWIYSYHSTSRYYHVSPPNGRSCMYPPGRIATTYVDRSTGVYVGTDSLHFTNKWTFDSSGRAANDFFEVRNGKKFSDNTTGRITIEGRLLSIRQKNTAKYVIRGCLELPNMTILKIAGPWFDDQEIPERVLNDFGPDSRFILTTKWVRTK